MPIHDWSREEAGIFQDFHQRWIIGITKSLNGYLLPDDSFQPERDAEEATRVVIHDGSDDEVAGFIKIVSPGNDRSEVVAV